MNKIHPFVPCMYFGDISDKMLANVLDYKYIAIFYDLSLSIIEKGTIDYNIFLEDSLESVAVVYFSNNLVDVKKYLVMYFSESGYGVGDKIYFSKKTIKVKGELHNYIPIIKKSDEYIIFDIKFIDNYIVFEIAKDFGSFFSMNTILAASFIDLTIYEAFDSHVKRVESITDAIYDYDTDEYYSNLSKKNM